MDEESAKQDEYTDLCVTCRNYSSCIHVRNGKRPVQYCEEFEAYESNPVTGSPEPVEQEKHNKTPVFNGLCKNCGNRFSCMNASPDRIIWHCEEYV